MRNKFKFVHVFLVFLLTFSLFTSPLQALAIAEDLEDVKEEQDVEEQQEQEEQKETEVTKETYVEEVKDENPLLEQSKTEDTVVKDTTPENKQEEIDIDELNKLDELGTEEVLTSEKDLAVEEMLELEEEETVDYSNYELSFDEVTTTSNSITVTWNSSHDVEEFELRINGEEVIVPGEQNRYTFTDLIAGKGYNIYIQVYLDDYYYDYTYATPDWTEDELIPVSLIIMVNEDPSYNEKIQVRGLDESNKHFKSDEWLNNTNGQLMLPVGKHEVALYNDEDPSIAAVQTIEINAVKDYMNNPIQLQFKLKEMKEAAEPFNYIVSKVTDNSFTLKWNDVSKITGFRIYADADKDGEYFHVDTQKIEKGIKEYTLTGLASNIMYNVSFYADYLYNLEKYHHIRVKTDGADMDAPQVKFENEDFRHSVAEELGIHTRNVTEADMKYLEHLNYYHSDLSSLEGIQYAEKLRSLYLNTSELIDISQLAGLTSLSELSLGHNKVSDISAIKNLTKLTYLSLYNNSISDISSLKDLLILESLDLDNNSITNLDALAEMTELSRLDLANNEIKDIAALTNLKNVTYLRLGNNEIAGIKALSDMTQLEELYLQNNQVEDISPLKNITNLRDLHLSWNQISNIDALAEMFELEELSLNSNEINDISSLAKLTKLESLDLQNNNISDISALKNMKNLSSLYLSSNDIKDISSLAGLESIEYLDLAYNGITDISILRELPRLQTVYLYGNDISDESTITYLRNDGVRVYYDGGNGDWNDWDDEEEIEEEIEEIIIDREEVLRSFPEEKGFVVSPDGKSITLDLNKQKNNESMELTPEQTRMLIENKQSITLQKDGVQSLIPASSFGNSDEPVTIEVKEQPSDSNSLSGTYDFTIKQGTRTISQFKEGVTLTFNVNAERAKNPNNLKVFYFNEEKGKWENVGGTYSNGQVTVVTYHFSMFTVFEAANNDEGTDEIVIIDEDSSEEDEQNDSTPEIDEEEENTNEEEENTSEEEETTSEEEENTSEEEENTSEEEENTSEEEETTSKEENDNKVSQDGNKETPQVESVVEQDYTNSNQEEVASKTDVDSDNQSTNQTNLLPQTATNLYNYLVIGLLLLVVGMTIFYIHKRRALNE
ncbi:leucine-rich repeat domain-containing protein [Alkalicoccobacillus porphyridii]|uniref:LPXTG cell wall anchor domain-containing protein n=1 Tax=Alkalicoccobacillus porphyridii TaxID=2597270 RepID=A0A553ZW71_9BACI|nr:leucine-rich repeat domain-containing protein [Alkalicoccobacillus porphyridii]TSB45718.1 hypothetical protein FN960_14620 [Alkalicoccobacillus porphyridii]